MEQIAARVPEEIDHAIETFSDENNCSRSEAIRTLLERGVEYDELQIENERLQNEKRTLITDRQEKQELVEFVEREKTLAEQKAQAGLATRAKWWIWGKDD